MFLRDGHARLLLNNLRQILAQVHEHQLGRGEVVSLLVALRESWLLIVAVAICGGVLGLLAARMRPYRYRASSWILVVEPRIAGSYNAVDFNLTPIRSYRPLFSAPDVCGPCLDILRGAAPAPLDLDAVARGLEIKMPEHTRVLEVSYEAATAQAASDFVNCIVGGAVDANRKINEALAKSVLELSEAAYATARQRADELEARLREVRERANIEWLKAEMRSTHAVISQVEQEEQRHALRLAEARSRRATFAKVMAEQPALRTLRSAVADSASTLAAIDRAGVDAGAGAAVVHEEADPVHDLARRGVAEATAEEAGATAALAESRRLRQAASREATAREAAIARVELELELLQKSFEGATMALWEIQKRRGLAPLETATKAFELIPIHAATPPSSPSSPPPLLTAMAAAVIAGACAGLYVLSTPGGRGTSTGRAASPPALAASPLDPGRVEEVRGSANRS
ncbi:MAG: hypothetical protein HYV63_27475 [Candidatus Schekmanbacteria bacterium]|nr:hypothetical protein [Candidatus Schekmanbacteria bacterium]